MVERYIPMEDYELPRLLTNSQAQRFFDMTPLGMFDTRPEMFYLDAPGQLFRYPKTYATALRENFGDDALYHKLGPAQEFAQTPEAEDIITAETDYLDIQIKAISERGHRGLISASEAMSILFIGRSTITNWRNRGEVEIVKKDGQVHMTESSFRDVCVWHHPEVLENE